MNRSDLFAGLGKTTPGLVSAILAQVHGWGPGSIIALFLAVSFALPITSKAGNSLGDLLDRVIETKGPGWFGLPPEPAQKSVTKSKKKAAPALKAGKVKQAKSPPASSGK